MIDQHEDANPRGNIVGTITEDKRSLKFSSRPVEDQNEGWGCPEFASQEKLQERRYIVDDTIFIQFQIASP